MWMAEMQDPLCLWWLHSAFDLDIMDLCFSTDKQGFHSRMAARLLLRSCESNAARDCHNMKPSLSENTDSSVRSYAKSFLIDLQSWVFDFWNLHFLRALALIAGLCLLCLQRCLITMPPGAYTGRQVDISLHRMVITCHKSPAKGSMFVSPPRSKHECSSKVKPFVKMQF